MGLESTMICVDTSDFMRNGDFVPTRLQAQQDAVYLVCRAKARAHPENDVGLLTMADVRVLVTLTTDIGKVLVSLNKLVVPHGNVDFLTGLKVAQLALRHRQEKRNKMRIVAFVGSPITLADEEAVTLAKKLKKEKVTVDVVSFGAEAEAANSKVLTSFIDTLNGKEGGNNHLLIVSSGPFLTGALVSSEILVGEGGSGVLPGDDYDWGVDSNDDPELALALKMSLAEQQRLEAQAGSSLARPVTEQESGSVEPTGYTDNKTSFMTEEEQIALAIEMSLAHGLNEEKGNVKESTDSNTQETIMTEEEFLRLFGHLLNLHEEEEEEAENNGQKEGNDK